MDRLETMRIFVAVAEAEGFAAAARRLGLSAPLVTRAVAALEERVGARLLLRTTRVVRLTEAGQRLAADCRQILAAVDDAEAAAHGDHGALRGPLGITAPVLFGRRYVTPLVLEFLARHPGIRARVHLADGIVDIIEQGLDVAVRIAHLPDSSLSATRVGALRRLVCAAPSYLAAHGAPRTLEDLLRHEAVGFSQGTAPMEWAFLEEGRERRLRPPGRLLVNSAEAAVAAAVAGHGLVRLLSYQVAPELQAGALRVVLAEYELPPTPIHIVRPATGGGRRPRDESARVRRFVELVTERLRADPALQAGPAGSS